MKIKLVKFDQGYVFSEKEHDDVLNPKYKDFSELCSNSDEKNINSIAEEIIKDTIRKNEFLWNSAYHQVGRYGAPVFEDEKGNQYIWTCSMRYWGEIMSDALNPISKDTQYDYLDFYIALKENDPKWNVPKSETDFI